MAVKTPDDLDAARGLIASQAEYGQGEHTPDFRVVVTPAKGVFTRAEGVDEGSAVAARHPARASIRTNRDEHVIVAPHVGRARRVAATTTTTSSPKDCPSPASTTDRSSK